MPLDIRLFTMQLGRVVPDAPVVPIELGDLRELREWPAQLVAGQRRAREPRSSPRIPATPKNGFGSSSLQNATEPPLVGSQRSRSATGGVLNPAQRFCSSQRAAADVGELHGRPPRQLSLEAQRELVHVRIHEVGVSRRTGRGREAFPVRATTRAPAGCPARTDWRKVTWSSDRRRAT